MKQALKVTSPFYVSSLIGGLIVAYAFPEFSQAFVNFASTGTIGGALIQPFLEFKSLIMLGLFIFLFNFLVGTFARFILIPILFYHASFILAVSMGFFFGFVVGSPTSLSHLSDFSSFGTILYILTIIFENMGYITACAIGYKIAKKSQEGLTTKEILLKDLHLKNSERRKIVKRELSANVRWILFSMIFIAVGTLCETLLIICFR